MKKFLWALALASLFGQQASAQGTARYVEEGTIKIRYYYDKSFRDNNLASYSNLPQDMLSAMQFTGKYRLGLKFQQDTTPYTSVLDMGAQKLWSWAQIKTWMDKNMPIETGVVKILFHARGMTNDGVCLDDSGGGNVSSYTDGLTYRASPANGVASSHITVTAKQGCTQQSFSLKSQASIKTTLVHEVSHALGHPGFNNPHANCGTAPQASIACHAVKPGVVKHWQKWFSSDVTLIRNDVFDGKKSQYPLVSCYEFSSYQNCDTQCVNTAGFPSPGATEVYNNCVNTYCKKMCK